MDVSDGGLITEVEEDVRAENGGDHGTNTVKSLGNVDADLGISWRTANCGIECQLWALIVSIGGLAGDERISGRFEGAKAVANDEDTGTEATEGFILDAGNGKEGTQGVETETPDEYGPITVVTKDPSGVANRGQRVGTLKMNRVNADLSPFLMDYFLASVKG